MKKILLFLLPFLLLGCHKSNYDNYVEKAFNSTKSDSIPFNVELHVDDSGDELLYQIIIDNPIYELKNVKAIVVHDGEKKSVYPSIGIVDDTVTLNNDTKGINLIGYTNKQDLNFKLYLETNDNVYSYKIRYNMQEK